jgi:hypothetical protein
MTIAMLMKNTVNLALLTLGQSGSVILREEPPSIAAMGI